MQALAGLCQEVGTSAHSQSQGPWLSIPRGQGQAEAMGMSTTGNVIVATAQGPAAAGPPCCSRSGGAVWPAVTALWRERLWELKGLTCLSVGQVMDHTQQPHAHFLVTPGPTSP